MKHFYKFLTYVDLHSAFLLSTEKQLRPQLNDPSWKVTTFDPTVRTTPNGAGDELSVWSKASTASQPKGVCAARKSRGLRWPETLEGEHATIACPKGTLGEAVWSCERERRSNVVGFYPPSPILSQCKHAWVDEVQSTMESGKSVTSVGAQLNRNLRETENLVGGDLTGSLRILGQIVLSARQQTATPLWETTDDHEERVQLAVSVTESVGASSDFLLSDDVLMVWNDLKPQDKMREATLLMKNLESSADFLAKFMDAANDTHPDVRAFRYNKLAMKVEVFKSVPSLDDDPRVEGHGALGRSTPPPAKVGTSFADFNGGGPQISLPSLDALRSAVLKEHPARGQFDPLMSPVSGGGQTRSFAQDLPFDSRLRLGYFLFANLGQVLEPIPPAVRLPNETRRRTIVNSHVIGASVNDPTRSLRLPQGQPAVFRFNHLRLDHVSDPRCVFWNAEQSRWDEWGCRVVENGTNYTVCSCNHLTSFAVLMDLSGGDVITKGIHSKILTWITLVGCGISCACLLLCIVIFSCFRSLWSNRTTIHRNLCFSLLLANLVFVFGIERTENQTVCTGVAILLHYLFFAAFCWMLLEGYQLYLMLIKVFETEDSKSLLYHMLAYGFPAIIVAVSAGVAYDNYGTALYCWIDVSTPTIWAFVGPVAVVLVANVVFLMVAFRAVFKVHSVHDRSKVDRIKGWLKGSTMLLCLLGITWALAYFTAIKPAAVYFHYAFTVVNSLQGLSIFVCHVLLNDKVRGVLVRWLASCCLSEEEANLRVGAQSSVLSSGQRFFRAIGGGVGGRRGKRSGGSSSEGASRSTNSTAASNARSPIGNFNLASSEKSGCASGDLTNWHLYQPLPLLKSPSPTVESVVETAAETTTEKNGTTDDT